jgi:hypothetical protein
MGLGAGRSDTVAGVMSSAGARSRTRARSDSLPLGFDHVRKHFADHDRRQISVGVGDCGHDGGIGDPEVLDAVDP